MSEPDEEGRRAERERREMAALCHQVDLYLGGIRRWADEGLSGEGDDEVALLAIRLAAASARSYVRDIARRQDTTLRQWLDETDQWRR